MNRLTKSQWLELVGASSDELEASIKKNKPKEKKKNKKSSSNVVKPILKNDRNKEL